MIRRKSKYFTCEQRDTLVWLDSLRCKIKDDTEFFKREDQERLKKLMKQIENTELSLMEGIDKTEGDAVLRMAARVRPILATSDFTNEDTEDIIKVDADHYYKLAEMALEYCKFAVMVSEINKMTNAKKIKEYLKDNFKCQECKDPGTCQLRQVLLNFLVPPLTEEGPCQYYRGEE